MKEPNKQPKLIKDWKYYTGMTLLVLSIVLPLFGLLVPILGLPVAVTAFIVGSFIVGGPEIMIVLAAIFLGKDTVSYYKIKFFSFFKKEALAHKPVSRFRYYTGLTIMIFSIVPLYLAGYYPEALPQDEEARYFLLISMDILFVVSFFICGGDFWEKFKRLFIWDKPKV